MTFWLLNVLMIFWDIGIAQIGVLLFVFVTHRKEELAGRDASGAPKLCCSAWRGQLRARRVARLPPDALKYSLRVGPDLGCFDANRGDILQEAFARSQWLSISRARTASCACSCKLCGLASLLQIF